MNKFFLLALSSLSFHILSAQNKTEDFEIAMPEQKVPNSLYNKIHLLDSRPDTSQMGIVQLGAFNRKARVVPKTPLGGQLKDMLNALIDSSAKDGYLLLQVRQLNFAEVTGSMSERGYCYMRASLYAAADGWYRPLSSIDTVIVVKSMDVTKALFRNGSKVIAGFIAGSLSKPATDPVAYSFQDIRMIDSIEKSHINLYTATGYKDGVYTSYVSFMSQVPDKQATVIVKDGAITSVKAEDESGKMVKIRSKNIYAIVQGGQPFIATEFGYYLLSKLDNDFYFTGKAKVSPGSSDVIAASMFFGVLGGLLAADAESTFDMKLDHMNGGFIRLREIKAAPEP